MINAINVKETKQKMNIYTLVKLVNGINVELNQCEIRFLKLNENVLLIQKVHIILLMKKKIKKPKGLFSMNDVYNEVHKYDCREVVFGGWDAATIKSRNQGFGWTLFTLPKPPSNVNQSIPIDYKKTYHPTVVNYKNFNISESSSIVDDDSFTNSVLMTCPKVDFTAYPKRATSVSTSRSTSNKLNSLPSYCLYDLSTDISSKKANDKKHNHNINKRPKTENERKRKQSPTEYLTLNYASKSLSLNSNLNRSAPLTSKSLTRSEIKSQTSDQINSNSKCHICSINQMVKMPPKRPVFQGAKGDDPNHFPFRMSISVLNEFAKEQQEKSLIKVGKKKKSKSKISKHSDQNHSRSQSLTLTPRSQSSVV